MVDTLRLRPWTPPPDPVPEGERARRIPGPIYDLATVQHLAHGGPIYLASDRCEKNVEALEWDTEDIAKFIAALRPNDYRNSEWCQGRSRKVIAADVYALHYDHIAACRSVSSRHPQYYLKFGFRHDDPRLTVWVMSCHLS